MKRFLFFLYSLCLFSSLFAQTKHLAIDEIMTNRNLQPARLTQLQWEPETENFCYAQKNIIIFGKATDSKYHEELSMVEINKGLKKAGLDTLKYLSFSWAKKETLMLRNGQSFYLYNRSTKKTEKINELPKEAQNEDMEPNGHKLAYTINNNLSIAINGITTAITNDANKGIVNGKAVHRDEFGIKKGTFWSPTGNFLAFYRMDETMVTDYPIVHVDNVSNRIAEVENIKYPMAGMTSHEVTIGVFNIATSKTLFLKTGEPKDQYLTSITWSPDEKYIYVPILNRDQNYLKVNKYDAKTGEFVKTLFEEKNEKYVEPENGLFFYNKDPSKFLWFSKRDGWNHLYQYDNEGKLISQVTKGTFDLDEFLGYAPNGKSIVISASAISPLEKHAFIVDLSKSTIQKISEGKGFHQTSPNSSFTYFIDSYSNSTLPMKYQILDVKGKISQEVFTAENPLKDYVLGETSIFTIKADDGSDLYCRMIKPSNFDPKKKYPVFYYVYGGPHMQLIQERWLGASDLFMQYMADQGYVVFTLDNHGTPNRGLAFEQVIHRNLGTIEISDQMKGVNYLKKLSFVDSTRMGIQGWSFGGFMTVSLMLKQPGVFKAAVAGGPVIDWKLYEIMYGERYMDTPQSNPDGYKNACLLNFVDNLKGRLLIIHGSIDPTVVWEHSLLFEKKCIEKGKLVDYFVYPEHEHNVRGKDRAHLYKLIERYMKDNL